MTDTLFDLPDSPSPRLEWMRRHGVTIRESVYSGTNAQCFIASTTRTDLGGWYRADTEDEALAAFARGNNLKLWNEE